MTRREKCFEHGTRVTAVDSVDLVVADDRDAVAWAVFSQLTPSGKRVAERMSRSQRPAVTAELLVAILDEWDAAGRPIVEPHTHRDAVVLSDGTTVIGARFLVPEPYTPELAPSFGLYLDEHWSPPWAHSHLLWPDFGVPNATELRAALGNLLSRARSGERVEVGCLGGHGRTGTALACLAVLTGTPPHEAVAWVRAVYCHKAVETDEQSAFVTAFG